MPADVRLVSTRTSLLGTHRLYAQVRAGEPVAGGWYVVHDWSDRAATTDDLRRTIEASREARLGGHGSPAPTPYRSRRPTGGCSTAAWPGWWTATARPCWSGR